MSSKKIGILSAVLASVCCMTLLLIVLLGIGSLGLGTLFTKYHWLFSGISLIVLTFAWYLYFKEKKKISCACEIETSPQNENSLSEVHSTL